MTPFRARFALPALLAASLAACAGSSGSSAAPPAPARAPETASGPSREELDALEALYAQRRESARQQFTPADVHFVTGMIAHHSQALIMAALSPTHGASPSVRTLSARIMNAQRDEIALMGRWLDDREQTVPDVQIDGLTMEIHGAEHDMTMPGMLTQDQLRQLDAARDAEFDRLFLTLMIQHHQGAVTMVHELFATDGAGQDEAVFKLASDIQVDQTTEVARMERMLEGMRNGAPRR